jgi:hypothetical protein
MGGSVSTSSKVSIISPSKDPAYDVNYKFGQVAIDKPLIDYQSNCGNLSSAVGPFAIDEGLVNAETPLTEVRIFQVNTKKLIIAEVPVKDGLYNEEGDFAIDGVPGTGGKISLRFIRPEASVTSGLLPTGNVKDIIDVPGLGEIAVSIVDAGNPVVFIRAGDIGLTGAEISEIDDSVEIRDKLEAIRSRAAVMVGLAETPEAAGETSQAVPKIAFVSAPQEYRAVTGRVIQKNDIDMVGRIMSMGTLHKAYAVTGAISTAGAAWIEGTVVNQMLPDVPANQRIRLGHPGGMIPVGAKISKSGNTYVYEEGIIYRTARRLMEGYLCVPTRHFQKMS